jgi:hypothetical protein
MLHEYHTHIYIQKYTLYNHVHKVVNYTSKGPFLPSFQKTAELVSIVSLVLTTV